MNKNKTPTFQQSNKKFNERSAEGFASKPNKFSKKSDNSKFAQNPNPRFSSRSATLEKTIAETTMKNANGIEGKVKVLVKGTSVADKPREKKTGPLSPRAPEKIKKNRAEEMKVYGENTCQALFVQRPESIVRIWATVEMAKKSGELFKYLAEHKKVYHVVDNAELTLVSGTEHHGGICMLVKKMRPLTLSGYLDIPRKRDCLVFIDAVQNAHNLGGIIRTSAAFAVKGIVVEHSFVDRLNSSAAMRVAEGGMEYVRVLETEFAEKALQQLREAGYQIIHLTRSTQGKSLVKLALSEKVVFVLNEKSEATLAQQGDEQVCLSHVNPLNANLNVAVAAGILLSKWDCSLA
ncbi:rRNA methyltransferase [[Haemophilus] felis]|nr:rRNA methyltransferase [[Haemophilus] felis]